MTVVSTTLPKPSKAESRREQLLSAAARCITRLGLHQSRMEDIASEAGVKRITIYREFGNREALIGALIAQRLAAFNERFAVTTEQFPDLLAALETYLLISASAVRENPITRELVRGPMDFTRSGSPLHAITLALWQPWLERARESGGLSKSVNYEVAAEWILIVQATLSRIVLDTEMPESHMKDIIRSFILPAFQVK